jgi:hypothetical protein
MAEPLPPELRDQVSRTLRPVSPLRSPARRTLALLPVAVFVLAAVPLAWGVRYDALSVGPLLLWLGSALQIGVGLALIAAAVAECVPGRLGGPWSLAGRATASLAFVAVLTFLTFAASPTYVPFTEEGRYLRICLTRPIALGLLPLIGAGLLMRRGLAARPVVAGVMAGLGSGLIADAGWRVYCQVSDPSHVFGAHVVGIVVLVLLGGLSGVFVKLRPRAS